MLIAWKRLVLLAAALMAVLSLAPGLKAQVLDATDLTEPVELGGLWRMQMDDNPAYARTDFDDSKWQLVDVAKDPRGYVGHAEPEVLWYRLQVKVPPTKKSLALEENNLGRAYEIYINGKLVLRSGQVKPYHPYSSQATIIATIPAIDTASGLLVIAVRAHCTHVEWLSNAPPGLFRTNLHLGPEGALRDRFWVAHLDEHGDAYLISVLGFGVGLVALALFAVQRSRVEYLWLFLVGFFALLESVINLSSALTDRPENWFLTALFTLERPLSYLATIALYFASLRIRVWRWLCIFLGVLLLVDWILNVAWENYPHASLYVAAVICSSLAACVGYVVLPVLLIAQARRGNREAGVLLIPNLLWNAYGLPFAILSLLYIVPAWSTLSLDMRDRLGKAFSITAGPFTVNLVAIALNLFFWIAWALILVWRSNRTSTEQARLESEMEAARQVQQVILPEPTGSFPGFRVETVYRPAQQVGGDFFQVLPAGEGGLLLVLGDVAGKGMPAAMLVAVLVGAIRTIAGYTSDPGRILAELNARLLGRSSGFSTCLAITIDREGRILLANAGQLAPYLDGRELETAGALPLGLIPEPSYEVYRFKIEPGSRLVFYSDGVVEAQSAKGELFGFERSREIAVRPAAEIAEAAALFGQSDDITVVTIEREAVEARVAELLPALPAPALS